MLKPAAHPDSSARPHTGAIRLRRALVPAALGAIVAFGCVALPAASSAPAMVDARAAALPQRVLLDTPFPTARHYVTKELTQMVGERTAKPGLFAPLAAHRNDMLGGPTLFTFATPEPDRALRAGDVELSLADTLNRVALPPEVRIQLGDLVSGKLPMHARARHGDYYRIAFGSTGGTPRLTAFELRADGRTFGAVWFKPPGADTGAYYAFDGTPLEAAAFTMPVQWTRISSFFGERVHPLSQAMAFHTGVDLAAPAGTRVDSAADGVVSFVGIDPGGYGKYVIVDHADRYSTYYAHLSAFAPGLKVGDTVRQGERLGAVGMTGAATGPHLHFEVRVADQPVDPLVTLANAQTELSGMRLAAFRQDAAQWRLRLASTGMTPVAFVHTDGPLWGDFASGKSTLRAIYDAQYAMS